MRHPHPAAVARLRFPLLAPKIEREPTPMIEGMPLLLPAWLS
jgi:hypothetical protein